MVAATGQLEFDLKAIGRRYAADEMLRFIEASRAPRLRTMQAFAEQEIIIPNGEYVGRTFKCDYQPFSRHLFALMDEQRWTLIVVTGVVQSGKTLMAFVIPTLYHLFEIGETVICGLPSMDMAKDKWQEDLLPVIERTQYRQYLPRTGGGSKGGTPGAVRFTNGATLRFMGAGGGDAQISAFTARVVVITEADKIDDVGASSDETDKIRQFYARTRAFKRRRIYTESTVTHKGGHTWGQYTQHNPTKLALHCPHCRKWVVPTCDEDERKLLRGWQDAPDQQTALDVSRFHCSQCGKPWDERDRAQANRESVLLHSGQTIRRGRAVGSTPRTRVVGFRWSAINNMLLTAGDIGEDEWIAQFGDSEDDDEAKRRNLMQFVWCLPCDPPELDMTPLQSGAIRKRLSEFGRGVCPADTEYLTIGVDLGKFLAHYLVIAFRASGTPHIVDYGQFEIPTDEFGVERGTFLALREFRDRCISAGWGNVDGGVRHPDQVFVDCNYADSREAVIEFCRETRDQLDRLVFQPSIGRGSLPDMRRYARPKGTTKAVQFVGDGYHVGYWPAERMHIVEIDADYWKSWVHQRLTTPLSERGAMTLFDAPQTEHTALSKHLTAERGVEEFVPEKGMVRKWKAIRRQNHWFDCCYMAAAAGHLMGWRLNDASEPNTVEGRATMVGGSTLSAMTTPDGRPWSVTDR